MINETLFEIIPQSVVEKREMLNSEKKHNIVVIPFLHCAVLGAARGLSELSASIIKCKVM